MQETYQDLETAYQKALDVGELYIRFDANREQWRLANHPEEIYTLLVLDANKFNLIQAKQRYKELFKNNNK